MKNKSGVYLLIKDNTVIYVGQSYNINKRLLSHHYGFGCEVIVVIEQNSKRRLELESSLIRKLKPIYNNNDKDVVVNVATKEDVINRFVYTIKENNRLTKLDILYQDRKHCQRRGLQHTLDTNK